MDDLWNFLKSDAGRSSIALCAILVSASVAITIFLLNRKRKALIYEILSMTRVLTIKEELSGRVKILFDGETVEDVGLVRIRVMNSGTEPIRASDFVKPVSFSVNEGARIIDAEVTSKRPQGMEASLSWANNGMMISPMLMNSKDELTLKLLVANFNGKIIQDARIEGTELKQQKTAKFWPALVNGGSLFIGVLLGVFGKRISGQPQMLHSLVFASVFLCLISTALLGAC